VSGRDVDDVEGFSSNTKRALLPLPVPAPPPRAHPLFHTTATKASVHTTCTVLHVLQSRDNRALAGSTPARVGPGSSATGSGARSPRNRQ
jgi:hypothetical protein